MPETTLTVEQILERLAAAPQRIDAAAGALTEAQLRLAPSRGEWAATDVLAHIRACGEVWGGYIRRIVEEDRPAFSVVSPRRWIRQTDYLEQDFRPAARAFADARAGLLALLRSLPPEGWTRTATVKAVGKPYERTVYDYAERLARHEWPHLRQIEEAVRAVSPPDARTPPKAGRRAAASGRGTSAPRTRRRG